MTSAALQLASGDTNNHQCIFEFNGECYIAYHTQKPAQAMGLRDSLNYRTASIDKIRIDPNGAISPVTMTMKGAGQTGHLDPYAVNEAETMAIMGGIYTRPAPGAGNGMVVTGIDSGDWIGLYGVDFGADGARKFAARVRLPETPADYTGAIEIRLDPAACGATEENAKLNGTVSARISGGEVIGRVLLKAKKGEAGKYGVAAIELNRIISGVHNLAFVFYSSLGARPETIIPDSRHVHGFEFDQWQFFK